MSTDDPDNGGRNAALLAQARAFIEAGKKAVNEGTAIVEATAAALKIEPRSTEGPLMKKWARGEIGVPATDPRPEYTLTEDDRENVQAVITMLALARATKRPGTKRACYLDAGLHLQKLRDAPHRLGKAEFALIVGLEIDLSVRRAYELMKLAAGKPIDELRAETAARVKKHRRAKKARDQNRIRVRKHRARKLRAEKRSVRALRNQSISDVPPKAKK